MAAQQEIAAALAAAFDEGGWMAVAAKAQELFKPKPDPICHNEDCDHPKSWHDEKTGWCNGNCDCAGFHR